MKRIYLFCLLTCFFLNARSQKGYHITINFKGCTDSAVYLARYFFDQLPVIDSCKNFSKGKIVFKGETELEKGVYFLANQAKTAFYFQFIVDNNQKFTINTDAADLTGALKSDDKLNELFFAYVKYMTVKNRDMSNFREQFRGKPDSARQVAEKQEVIHKEMSKFDADFMVKSKGTFVHDLMNLKTEKYAPSVPLASNGRPDSVYQYYYYKNHYFDGINFKDDRIIHTPFFAEKLKKYFEHMVPSHPDSVIKELDKILVQAEPGSKLFNHLIGYFTREYESNKSMSFDQYGKSNTMEKVFIHLADKYIVSGKTHGYYSAEVIVKVKEKIDILRNLLPGSKVPDLYMIDTVYGRQVLKMGFDTARSSQSVTYLFQRNQSRLAPMYKTLHELKAKYTVLVFWAADCGHCQTEVPKLHDELSKIKGKVDFKVYAVQTKEELFDTWKKFIAEKKMNEFTHVFDPIHLNNLKEQFDIVATPVIYLLDKDKKIIGKKIGSEQVVEIILKLEEIEKDLKK